MSTHAKPFKVKSMEEQIGNNGEILSVNTLGKKIFNCSTNISLDFVTPNPINNIFMQYMI